MDVLGLLKNARKNNELIAFVKGQGNYHFELNEMVPAYGETDVSEALSGIYELYNEEQAIKEEFEDALLTMLGGSDFEVYLVAEYIIDILFDEENDLATFTIDKARIFDKFSEEVKKREKTIGSGIKFPSGVVNTHAMSDLKRWNRVCQKEYGVVLF